MYPVALLLVLSVLAGFIAYAGDVLGTTVGRRRLSLFGWRPKRTGRVVGVAAGVLVMLSTMGVLSLAFRDATGVLLRSQQAARELEELRGERTLLEQQVVTTEEQLAQAQATIAEAERARDRAREARDAALRIRNRIVLEQGALRAELTALEDQQTQLGGDNAALQATNAELALSNETLDAGNALLRDQNTAFQNTVNNLQNQVVTLGNERRELRRASEREAQNLRDTLSRLETASGSELTYRDEEIVHSDLIAESGEAAILAALNRFVVGARQAVIGRGARDVELSTEQVTSLARAVAETPGEDLVVLVAADNFVGAAQVQVEVEAYGNEKLLGKGQLIASRQVYVGGAGAPVSRAALQAEVARLTQTSLNRLQLAGLFERVRPTPSEADFASFVSLLTQLSGPVVIGATARETVFVAGPAELEFVILSVP